MRPLHVGFIVLTRALAAALCLAVAPAALAQTAWPAKPVRIMVPFAPGALTDVAARAIAQELSQQLGQQFVVENRGGGGGTLGRRRSRSPRRTATRSCSPTART